jgi:hypothetical protein
MYSFALEVILQQLTAYDCKMTPAWTDVLLDRPTEQRSSTTPETSVDSQKFSILNKKSQTGR